MIIALFALILLLGCIDMDPRNFGGVPGVPNGSGGSGTGNGSGGDGGSGTAPPSGDNPDNGPIPPTGGSGNGGNDGGIPSADIQGQRAFIQYIADDPNALISQIISALEMAQVIHLSADDPLLIQLTKKAQDHIDAVVDNPNSSIKEMLEAIQIAQAMGFADNGALGKVTLKADAKVKAVLSDPNAGIPDLILASQLAQQLGSNESAIQQQVVAKIKLQLIEKIKDPALCKAQLLEVAELAKSLEIEGVDKNALAAVPNAKTHCATINYSYNSDDKLSNIKTHVTAKLEGTFEELSQFGFGAADTRTYFVKSGTLSWTYFSDPDVDSCVIARHTGMGTETVQGSNTIGINPNGTLSGGYESSMTVNSDGSFSGKPVRVTVTITSTRERAPVDPNNPDACDYITAADLAPEEERHDIEVSIQGTSANKLHLVGSYAPTYENTEDYVEDSHATFDIQLPDKLTRVQTN